MVIVLLWAGSVYLFGAGLRWTGRLVLRPDPARRLAELTRRDALARELHDSLGHALAAISVQTAALEARLGSEATAPVRRGLTALASASRQAQAELDEALGLLRDGEGPGLDRARWLVDGFSEGADSVALGPDGGTGQRRITLHSELSNAELTALDAATSRAAYRILQEAITNAVRHAQGPVAARIGGSAGTLVLEVIGGPPSVGDGGTGTAAGSGSGLTGMRRRAALAGGQLDVDRAPGGWTVTAELPR